MSSARETENNQQTPMMWNLLFVSATAESQDFWKVGSRRCVCTFFNGEPTGNFLLSRAVVLFLPFRVGGERG